MGRSRILVTGATGFLGRYVVACLRAAGLEVTPASRSELLQGGVRVNDYASCPGADVIVHLAEEPDRAQVNRTGQAYIEKSAATVKALLCSAGTTLVYASSGVVYGDQSAEPFKVDAETHGTDVYAQAKLMNEALVLQAGGSVLRFSNLIGEGMSARNVLSDILAQLPGDRPLRIRDGAPVRDYLCVDDAAQAVVSVVQASASGILNVGSGVGISVSQLARLALEEAGQSAREIEMTAPTQRASCNVLDIALTTQALGWRPRRTLQEEVMQRVRNKLEVPS